YGEKIITLQVKELLLDLAYHCKIEILEHNVKEINEHIKNLRLYWKILVLVLSPSVFLPVIWGEKYAWPCETCHNAHCFYKCNKAYIIMNWG
ncbi:MAG: hypothetical protein WBZ36_12935, partial [Candidatus Nitrosopolaris sp.]